MLEGRGHGAQNIADRRGSTAFMHQAKGV